MAQAVICPSCEGLPDSWASCQDYLLGVDLFNLNYLWEAHEAWEVVWIGAGKTSGPGLLAQGLIQVSAALLRLHLGTPVGASSLLDKARVRFDRLQATQKSKECCYMGLAIEDWWSSVLRFAQPQSTRFPFIRLES